MMEEKTLDDVIREQDRRRGRSRSLQTRRRTTGRAQQPRPVADVIAKHLGASPAEVPRSVIQSPRLAQERPASVSVYEQFAAERRREVMQTAPKAIARDADRRLSVGSRHWMGGFGRPLEGATLKGKVKSFSEQTGWGFLRSDSISSRDIFLHIKECDEDLGVPRIGEVLEFEVQHTNNGEPQAVRVRHAEPEPRRRAEKPMSSEAAIAYSHGLEWRPTLRQSLRVSPRTSRVAARSPPGVRVRVGNFPWTLSAQKLQEAFDACGEVLSVHMDEDNVGQASVTFATAEAASVAVEEYDQGMLNGRRIFVVFE